jgi:release factor glutamine methyltransferase
LDFAAGDVASISIGSEAVSRPRILDLCTGTGCVGISVLNTLLAKKGDAEVVISDVSEAALAVASENIKEASVAPSKISAIKLDVLAEDIPEGEFDVITANPPYINRTDMDELDVEVGKFEPHLALAGGDDGLIFYPHICNIALKCLKKGGALIVEHGYDQGKQVSQTLVNKGFNNVKVLKDFGGNDRVTFGIKQGG